MQGLSSSTVTASGRGFYCTDTSWRKGSNSTKNVLFSSGSEKQFVWNLCTKSLPALGRTNVVGKRNFMVKVGWLFNRGDQGSNASSERSESANVDLLIFCYQIKLGTQVQVAWNTDQYEAAKQLRNKLTEVEAEVVKYQHAKRGLALKTEAQDKAICLLRLRADLQKAIDGEDYGLAEKLRDEISNLEADSLAATAKTLAFENAKFAYRLGQKLRHKKFGYRAVVCGMDPVCCESSSWMETAQVDKLSQGPNQPFYQVLVDQDDDSNSFVAYVAEENLVAPEEPDLDRVDHLYVDTLFYGMDSAGDFIPIKQLREMYNKPRHEVPVDPQDEEDGVPVDPQDEEDGGANDA